MLLPSPSPSPPARRHGTPPPSLLLLLLLLALGGAGSARENTDGRNSGSVLARWVHASRGDGQGFGGPRAVSFLAPEWPQTEELPRRGRPRSRSSPRIPFQLDFTDLHRRFESAPEVSDETKNSYYEPSSDIVSFPRRYRREDENICIKFEEGDPVKKEFYSPGYPSPYPKNISCYRVLEADPGMVLKVEFRDKFALEDQEKCNYDFLEVRDGKYGYSRLLGRFCRAFPFPEITSSSRFLWLYFHSDTSIQGSGFRAVWSMIPRPPVKTPETAECVLNVTDQFEYEIKTTEIADRKKTAAEQGTELDCIWNITVKDGWKIQMTFPQFHLDKPNECDINYVQVYDKEPSMTNNPSLINNFCGSIADLVTSKGNEAYLRFFVTKAAINSSFEAIMTAIREKENKDKGCEDNEFDCQDACISDELRCNFRPNCRYRFDEDADVCNTEKSGLNVNSEHVIIILVVFSLLMSGLCFTFIFNCMKKLIRDHRIIKEHIRQSRENRLDELGRKSTPMLDPCSDMGNGDHHHHHGSESPSLEVLANPKELISPVAILGREYSRERATSPDLSDIHHSNNVSNMTQERLQESSEERETRDMECQTRESLFDTGFVLKPLSHPAFTTFGFQSPPSSRKQSLDYHPTHHYHHHAHPHYHPEPYNYHHHQHAPLQQQHSVDMSPPPVERSPASRRCSACHPISGSNPRLCLRHSSTPIVPAPPGWSAHESNYNPEDLVDLQHLSPGVSPARGRPPCGSGENYRYIYGHEDSTDHTGSSGATSTRSGAVKPVKCPQVADSRFKTEAIIEVDQKRPFSIESTKSAPDVIATH